MQLKTGGKFHLKLNIGARPIANKYREGKMKRTLKRELKVREIVEMETLETSAEFSGPDQPFFSKKVHSGPLQSAAVPLREKKPRANVAAPSRVQCYSAVRIYRGRDRSFARETPMPALPLASRRGALTSAFTGRVRASRLGVWALRHFSYLSLTKWS
jgi:hypothetical protein